MNLVLYDYWRSSAAYRVRIALQLKGLPYRTVAVDLRAGAQRAPDYLARNPQGLVPALQAGGHMLTQSGAILEWLEETHPSPALLPDTPRERQIVRAMAAVIGCDIHPVNNLRILNELRNTFAASEERVMTWIAHWIHDGFLAMEAMIALHGGRYAFGNAPSLADCYLVPQVYSAERFEVDVSTFPSIMGVAATARRHPAFLAAHPDQVAATSKEAQPR